MTVKEIIVKVCKILNEKELEEKLVSNEENVDFSERENKILNTLVDCFNFVQNEIAENYIPFKFSEEVDFGKRIDFKNLTKRIFKILEVKDENNLNLKYDIFVTYLIAERVVKFLTYSYLPFDLSLNDEIENYITESIYINGIVAEYYLISSMSTEAEIFDERFKDCLLNFSRKNSDIKLPSRRWI